ncbi:MAG: PPE domain-containing protein [Kibdelosporangium sp.]
MTREELEITRWRGFSHAELYAQLHNGPGASASAVPAGRWSDLAATLLDVSQDMTRAINDAKSSWAGAAANAAFAQLSSVASWAGEAGDSAALMQSSVEQQADHVGRARAAMPAPGSAPTTQPDPLLAPVVQLLGMQQDHEPIERATSESARKAFEVMQTYQHDTTGTTDTLAQFAEPASHNGSQAERARGLGHVQGFGHHETRPSLAPDFTSHSDHHHHRQWDEQRSRASGAAFLAEPAVDTRRPVQPLAQGAMTGADLTGTPVTATPQSNNKSRRTSRSSGRVSGLLPITDTPMASAVPPATAPAAGSTVAGSDRALPRRMGEPLLSGQWTDDAAEPAQRPARRRDRQDQDKITESVDGAESEVPPQVIGNEPYRP